MSDYYCLWVCTEIWGMRWCFVQKNEIGEYWNELPFAFLGHVILDGLKTWQFCVRLFFCLSFVNRNFVLASNQKRTLKFSVWIGTIRNLMYYRLSSGFGMGTWGARSGGSLKALRSNKLWWLGIAGLLVSTVSYHGQRFSSGIPWRLVLWVSPVNNRSQRLAKELYDYIAFCDSSRIFVP